MADEPARAISPISRRVFLAACAPLPAACSRRPAEPPGPRPAALPLRQFPVGARVTVAIGGRPVEVLRTREGVTARSLLCTHQGCEVAWDEGARVYACPCHEGTFDADGRPKAGPPPKPLATLSARVEGDVVLVGP